MLNVVCVLCFVKNEGDLCLYALIMQGFTFLSFLAVYPVMKKYLDWPGLKAINPLKSIKPAAIYFIPGLVTTIFSSTDKTMLGIMSSTYEVGIYDQAHKISQICMSAIASIGNVMLPRAAYIYKNGSLEEKKKANEFFLSSFRIVCFISAPIVFGIIAIAAEFIPVFFGEGYDDCYPVLVILSLNVGITALGNLCGQQLLIARGQQMRYNSAVLISAIGNIAFNYGFILFWNSKGAAIASVLAALLSLILILLLSERVLRMKEILLNPDGGSGISNSFMMQRCLA